MHLILPLVSHLCGCLSLRKPPAISNVWKLKPFFIVNTTPVGGSSPAVGVILMDMLYYFNLTLLPSVLPITVNEKKRTYFMFQGYISKK